MFFIMITIFIPNVVSNMPVPMAIIPMVVIGMSSLAPSFAMKEKKNLGNMHNKSI